jgi:hypothetical protein
MQTYTPIAELEMVNGLIPDGTRYLSANGTQCYKLPYDTYRVALRRGDEAFLAQVPTFDDGKLARARQWAIDRIKEAQEADVFTVMPVPKDQKHQAYGAYKKALFALLKACNAEFAVRDAKTAFAEFDEA